MKLRSRILIPAMALAFTILSACQQDCVTCTHPDPSVSDIEICNTDYPTDDDYELAIIGYENVGRTCE